MLMRPLDGCEQHSQALRDARVAVGLLPLLLAAVHHHQLRAAMDERFERVLPLTTEIAHGWAEGACERGEGDGVDAVGLGVATAGAREVARLAWVDERDRQAGVGERGRALSP